jgi:hypothetical protein
MILAFCLASLIVIIGNPVRLNYRLHSADFAVGKAYFDSVGMS